MSDGPVETKVEPSTPRSPWPNGEQFRLRPQGRVVNLGPPRQATSRVFQVVPTVISLILAVLLLIAFSATQRVVRIGQDLNRLHDLVAQGAVPPNRATVEAACLTVQRIAGEALPFTMVQRRVLVPISSWLAPINQWLDLLRAFEPTTRVPTAWGGNVVPNDWRNLEAIREAAGAMCDGVRYAIRARSATNPEVDLVASRGRLADALTSLVGMDLAQGVGRWQNILAMTSALRDAHASWQIEPDDLIALVWVGALADDPTRVRAARWIIVLDGHESEPTVMAVVTVEDGAIRAFDVQTPDAWQTQKSERPTPIGLVSRSNGRGWQLTDFDWWPDFRDSAHQFLALWHDAGHDPDLIDGIFAIDRVALDTLIKAVPAETCDVGATDDPSATGPLLLARFRAVLQCAKNDQHRGGMRLLPAMAHAAQEGHLVAWSRWPEVQSRLLHRGWAGNVVDLTGVVVPAREGPRAWRIQTQGVDLRDGKIVVDVERSVGANVPWVRVALGSPVVPRSIVLHANWVESDPALMRTPLVTSVPSMEAPSAPTGSMNAEVTVLRSGTYVVVTNPAHATQFDPTANSGDVANGVSISITLSGP